MYLWIPGNIIQYTIYFVNFYFQGKIATEGSYQNLKVSSFDFAKLLRPSERTDIENEIETNNTKTDSVNERLISPLHGGSNKSITSYKYENQLSDDHVPKPNKKLALQSYEFNAKNSFISYIMVGGSSLNILFCFFMCIFTQVLTTSGDFWLSLWYYLYDYIN